MMDHTDAAGTLYTYSQKIVGAKAGLARSMKVYPGDKVKIEGYAKYYNAQSTGTNLTAFAGTLLTAFGLPAPVAGELGTASSAVNSWGSVVAAGGGNGNNSFPKLFVNILVFDKNYNFLDIAFEQINGGEQVGVATKAPHDYMSREYTAKEAGYVFMYFSNESPTQVEFYVDDVAMTYTPTSVVQYNEYYPFGLQASTSWTREDSKNNFLYNEGAELNNTSGWYETFFRGYDPALERFMQVDPLATSYVSHTSYNYGLNNPIYFNDPNGADAQQQYDSNHDGVADWAQIRAAEIYDYLGWSSDGGGVAVIGRRLEAEQARSKELLSRARSGDLNALDEYVRRYGDSTSDPEKIAAIITNGFEVKNGEIGYYGIDATGSSLKGWNVKSVFIPLNGPFMYFQGVPVYHSEVGDLSDGAAFTTPATGIRLSYSYYKDDPKALKDLLRHEYGHILQVRRYGAADFSTVVAVSIYSAIFSQTSLEHQSSWTESQANTLSYLSLGAPADWNKLEYPIHEGYMNAVLKTDLVGNYHYP